jgi:outer membrane protein OmpA-like peptidoglycan-associated protein
MLVDLDDDGNVIGTIYMDYSPSDIVYFGEMPFVKCEEYQHRQNRRTTVRFTNNPADFGITVDVNRDVNNTNIGQSKFYERLRKGGVGHIREDVREFKYNFADIKDFNVSEALEKAYALPIFYDLDKAVIRPDAQKVLDEFAQKILLKYPDLVAELGSHTDCRMPYDYNVRLSKRRADSAVAYLRKRWNIQPNRIVAVGYGEHQKINDCSCEGADATEFTPFIEGRTKKMLVDLDDEGNVSESLYVDYEPYEITYIEGKPHVKCEEYQHRQNRRTTVRFANDPRDFGLEIDVDVDSNNVNQR